MLRIYADAKAGDSSAKIARTLNREGVLFSARWPHRWALDAVVPRREQSSGEFRVFDLG